MAAPLVSITETPNPSIISESSGHTAFNALPYIWKDVSTSAGKTLHAVVKVLDHHKDKQAILEQIRLVVTQSSDEKEALHHVSALLYLLHNQKDDDCCTASAVPWFTQVVERLVKTLHIKHTKHKETFPEKAQQNLVPKGATHCLLLHFAKILCPKTWNPAGAELIRRLLTNCQIARFLQQEHVTQILDLLSHPLEAEFSTMTTVHPSMTMIIRITLGLSVFTEVQPHHIQQALLMTLLWCIRQEQKEPNCYIIANIPYLISDHPALFARHLYRLLKDGYIALDGKQILLKNFFNRLNLTTDWTSAQISEHGFTNSLSIQKSLELCCMSQSSLPVYYSAYRSLNHASVPIPGHHPCYYLQALTRNPILTLFIASEELLNCALSQEAFLKQVRHLIEQHITALLATYPQKRIRDLIKDFTRSLIIKNIPSHYPSFYTRLVNLTEDQLSLYCDLKSNGAALFKIKDGMCYPLFRFKDLIRELTAHIRTYIPLFSPSILNQDMIPQLAALAAKSFNHSSAPLNRVSDDFLLLLDICIFLKTGGYSLNTLTHVLPFSAHFSTTSLARYTSTEELLINLQHVTFHHLQKRDRRSAILSATTHTFFAQLDAFHPFRMSTAEFQKAIKELVNTGQSILSSSCTEQQLDLLVKECYIDPDLISAIKQTLKPFSHLTIEQVIDALLAHAPPADLDRVKEGIQAICSHVDLNEQSLAALLQQFVPHLDTVALSQKWIQKIPAVLHPYQLHYYLHRLLIKEGMNFPRSHFNKSHQDYLEIADLNYTSYTKERAKHVHLIVAFNFATKRLEFFQAYKNKIFPNPIDLNNIAIVL